MRSRSGTPARRSCRRRSEEHTSELQSLRHLVCRLLLEKTKLSAHATSSAVPTRRCRSCGEAATATSLSWPSDSISTADLGFFFFNDTATTEIYTLSLHDALPISPCQTPCCGRRETARSCAA